MVGPVQQQEYIFFSIQTLPPALALTMSLMYQLGLLSSLFINRIDLSFLWLYFQTFCTKMFVAAIPICILFIFTLFVDINDTKAPGLGSFGNLSLIDLA